MAWAPRDLDKLISDPKEALDAFGFEPVARKNLPPAHFGYPATGIQDGDAACQSRGLLKFQLRPRRLVDISATDTTAEIQGDVNRRRSLTPDQRPIVTPSPALAWLVQACPGS